MNSLPPRGETGGLGPLDTIGDARYHTSMNTKTKLYPVPIRFRWIEYELLRSQAYMERTSISALVRAAVKEKYDFNEERLKILEECGMYVEMPLAKRGKAKGKETDE